MAYIEINIVSFILSTKAIKKVDAVLLLPEAISYIILTLFCVNFRMNQLLVWIQELGGIFGMLCQGY